MSDMFGGYDRYIYGEVFDSIADTTTEHGSYSANNVFDYFPSEPGYTLLNIFISFFTANRYIFILVITFLIYTLLFVSLKKYADNYAFAVILFMGLWFYFSFTYLRQVLGATIVWLSIDYIVQRRVWKFLLVVLIAMSVHKSAIIFFPVYFIPMRKFPPGKIIRLMLLVLLVGISPIPNALFSAYGDVSSVEMQKDYSASGGFRIAYALEAFFFIYFIISRYRYVKTDRQSIVMLNMTLLFCATLLFFVRSENGGRLSWYYMIGLIVTISQLATTGVNKRQVSLFMIALCLFLNVRIYNSWQVFLNLYPYKTFLTDGFRRGDYSYNNYEYDEGYTNDKLYRAPFRFEINF
ncbi:MAG: EpsG family protein [Bacteroidales bacterium]|nr:EpsG family protein [Bacteroidales bacterium]MCI7653147.1 EpsG family protein [Bacteroidales bacterium]